MKFLDIVAILDALFSASMPFSRIEKGDNHVEPEKEYGPSEDRAENESNRRDKRRLNYLGQTRTGGWLRDQWNNHLARLVGIILLAGAIAFFIMDWLPGNYFESFSTNFATELLRLAITVLLIDTLISRQREKRLKAKLIRQMGFGYSRVLAVNAAAEMKYYGWGFGEDDSLEGANLEYAYLAGAQLYKANLKGTILNMANLEKADLQEANLQGARLDSTDLDGAWLERADLRGAWLEEADLGGVYLDKANLHGAWLRWASLTGAYGVTPQQLMEAETLHGAYMPDGSRPDEWALKLLGEGEIDEDTFNTLIRLACIGSYEEE